MLDYLAATREEWIAYNAGEAEACLSLGVLDRVAQHLANIGAALKETA